MNARTALCTLSVASLLAAACGGNAAPASAPSPAPTSNIPALTADPLAAARADLAPTGTVRVGIFGKPKFVGSRDASGQLRGIAVDLASALGAKLGTPVVAELYAASPADAVKAAAKWDVLFIPSNADPETAAALAYTAPYLLIHHTFLVSDAAIRTVADLDKPTITIATDAAHVGQVHAKVPLAQVVTLDKDQGLAQLKVGKINAFADGKFDLLDDLKDLPAGYRVLDGSFFTATLAIGMAKERTAGLAWLKGFVEAQRSAGALQKLVDGTGKQGLEVPPAAY